MSRLSLWVIVILAIGGLVACGVAEAEPAAPQTDAPPPLVRAIFIQTTPSITPQPTTDTSTLEATPTLDITATPTITPNPTWIADPIKAIRGDHFWLARPFLAINGIRDYAERAYPYGTTALGLQPHHGMDIPNPYGTTVRAVANGTVFYAGDDLNDIVFGPQTNFYGNVVVIEHHMEIPNSGGIMLDFYTLYGHLSAFYVRAGDPVEQFQEVGAVGQEGVAIGPHLHLEVRIGDPYDYTTTYNPSLWVQPWSGYGVLAGRVLLKDSTYIPDVEVEVTAQDTQRTYSTVTYHYDEVNGDPWFHENFVIEDLPAGRYDVRVKYLGRIAYQTTVDVLSERTALINAIIE